MSSAPPTVLNLLGQPYTEESELPFTLGKKLGSGTHAVVHLGTRKAEGDEVAVKVVDKRKLKMSDALKLRREVDIHERCDHSHIVKMYGAFETESKVFIILEPMYGGELFDRIIERKKINEKDASEYMRHCFGAVSYMHSNGIVHRDLKPENILLSSKSDDAVLKIVDLGLSNRFVEEGPDLKTPCGTPAYLAPEVAKLQGYSAAVDMWSLGVVLYTMLCGFPPFYGKTPRELIKVVKRGKFSFPSPYWDKVSGEAKDLVESLLCVDATKRPSAADCLEHPWVKGTSLDDIVFDLMSPKSMTDFAAENNQEARAAVAMAIDAQWEEGDPERMKPDDKAAKEEAALTNDFPAVTAE